MPPTWPEQWQRKLPACTVVQASRVCEQQLAGAVRCAPFFLLWRARSEGATLSTIAIVDALAIVALAIVDANSLFFLLHLKFCCKLGLHRRYGVITAQETKAEEST